MRSRNCALLVFLAALPFAYSQQVAPAPSAYQEKLESAKNVTYPPQLTKELIQIREGALADDYAYHQVAHLTENIGARPEGSPQLQAADEYVADELRKLGLEVRLEPVMTPRWTRGPETAELVEYPGQVPGVPQKIILTAL